MSEIYNSMKTLFVTSTLPYINSRAHAGHLLEFVIADAISRHYKTQGKSVIFNTGLDEKGIKVQQTAESLNVQPQEYVDNLALEWIEFCQKFDIKYDVLYRTSSLEHEKKVQDFWNKAVINGDIYKKKYKGLYCVGCERFLVSADMEDGKCPDHSNLELQTIEEENYFFRMSKYKLDLIGWINSSPNFLVPSKKLQELINIIDATEDISISRQKSVVSWGVPVPDDDSQTIYVWYSALLNYVFSAGYEPGFGPHLIEDFNKHRWDGAIQTCGSDNLRFQAVIFQAMLLSAGIKNTSRLLVHGTILDAKGKKMSKTVGNVIDPIDQLEKYGIDAVRYYCLAGLNLCENSSWEESRLVEIYNSHLADDYGNLLARTLHLIDLKKITIDYDLIRADFYDIYERVKKIQALWDELKINEALEETNALVKDGNKKINKEEPWKKENDNYSRFCLIELHLLLSLVSDLYYPVIPRKSEEAKKALEENKKVILFKKIESPETISIKQNA
jgi:methionyl-tRNA synthetase